ncbi:MAG: hypothetical protein RI897_2795 [Verrucomicrobiota bacterium]|jgi:HEAT repeat protein
MQKRLTILLWVLALGLVGQVWGQGPTPLLTRSESELLGVLRGGGTLKERVDACRELSVVGSVASVPVLVEFLADEEMSHMARYALQTLPDPAVDGALREQLGVLKGRRLLGVMSSLGARGDEGSVRLLGRYLGSGDGEVAGAAARAMGRIGGERAARLLLEALGEVGVGVRLDVEEGLLRCAEGLLADGEGRLALRVYRALLAGVDVDHQVRAAAVRGLILGSERGEGLEILRVELGSEDYVRVAAAVRAAQEMAGVGVTLALAEGLAGRPVERQLLVIETLGWRGDVAALVALQAVVDGGEGESRVAAVRAMAGMRGPEVVPVLVGLLRHEDREVARAARESFAALRFPGVDVAVMRMVKSTDTGEQLLGLELVGRRTMVEAMSAVVVLAESGERDVRLSALRRLGELGGEVEWKVLMGLLGRVETSGDRDAVEQAMGVMAGRLDGGMVVGSVIEVIGKARPEVQAALLQVLGVVGGEVALRQVRALVDSESADVRVAALRTLSTWKTPDAAPELMALARAAKVETDRALCLRGYLGWVRSGELSVEQRLGMAAEVASLIQSEEEQKQFLGAAGSILSERALVLILPYLGGEGVAEEAAVAVASVVEPLLKRPTSAEANKVMIEALEAAVASGPSEGVRGRLEGFLGDVRGR